MEKKVKRFIHTSSTSIYEPQTTETDEKLITEESYKGALEGNFNYSQTKFLGESLVKESSKLGKLDVVILQPNFILGEHDILGTGFSKLFNKVFRRTLPFAMPGGGSFADVREVSLAMISAFERGKDGESYILGGEFLMHKELILEIGKQLKLDQNNIPQYVPPKWALYYFVGFMECVSNCCGLDPKITIQQFLSTSRIVHVDSSKAERELGYKITPVRKLVEKQIEYMKENELFEVDL